MSNVSNNHVGDENSPVENSSVSARELISVCRQIGGMMEAGVDILRVTRVLRAQTKNPRLLEWYDQFDHELTMGRGLPEALAQAPDLFSPFAVSLVRQGEERNDVAGAFLRVADFLVKEHESDARDTATNAPQVLAERKTLPATLSALDVRAKNVTDTGNFARENASSDAEWWWRRANLLGAGVLGALAIGEALVAAGVLNERWGRVAKSALSAGVLGALAASKSAPPQIVEVPQIAARSLDLLDETTPDGAISSENSASAWETPEMDSEAAPMQSAPIQRAPSWSEEVDTTRRIVKPPRDEEDFD